MYEHADQTWRDQPALMTAHVRKLVAQRVAEYVRAVGLREILVVFHGGEPLLAGASRIQETAQWIREALPGSTKVSFSMQTNGTLLTREALDQLASVGIGVSLSIDGPQWANDLHRLDHQGKSSYAGTIRALELLESRPDVYAGLIAVVDTSVPPAELLEFFASRRPPALDFLLPDANHLRHPPGRDVDPQRYTRWLLEAFDLWFDFYPNLPVRMFDAVLASAAGVPSDTDALGLGDVSLITIETDGTYHDLDVLKITAPGLTSLGLNLESHSIEDAIGSPQIAQHRRLLRFEGLSEECQQCAVVRECGGGSVPHRYAADGFGHPTVYCEEMRALIERARQRMADTLEAEIARLPTAASSVGETVSAELAKWERPETSHLLMRRLIEGWAADSATQLRSVLQEIMNRDERLCHPASLVLAAAPNRLQRLAIQPAIQLWTSVMTAAERGTAVRSIDGELIEPDPVYVWTLMHALSEADGEYPRLHREDAWLRLPFGQRILFADAETAKQGRELVAQAFAAIDAWRPALLREIRDINPDVQFIRDVSAHPDKAVSFSDNIVPGALYVGITVRGGLIDPFLLAEALIHEHRHQKLYLLQREVPLVEVDAPLVCSPWREDPRPPSGLLHAVFVFVHLHEFWDHLATAAATPQLRAHAESERSVINERISRALPILRATRLTQYGMRLVDLLQNIFHASAQRTR